MEGGFEAERGTARQAPGFEPPVDPGSGPSLRGLALVARIMRGRELAADAAGIPPLDSDQVLDLQRTAGNQLTTGALARWNDLLAEGTTAQTVPQALLGQLFAARAADPGAARGDLHRARRPRAADLRDRELHRRAGRAGRDRPARSGSSRRGRRRRARARRVGQARALRSRSSSARQRASRRRMRSPSRWQRPAAPAGRWSCRSRSPRRRAVAGYAALAELR